VDADYSDSSVPPSPDHVLLAIVEYDPSSDNPTQTFPIPPAITELGVDVGIVIFKVESNWGGDLTCLYRVCLSSMRMDNTDS
jgi:SUN domain-containing protein 1/2